MGLVLPSTTFISKVSSFPSTPYCWTSTNPVLLDLYVGLRTKRIKVGQLALVLPAHHPLQVAEDVAILDQMTGGRAYVGFARGYQERWVNTLAQGVGVCATSSDKSARDLLNREAFEEAWRIIKTASTSDTFSYEGKYLVLQHQRGSQRCS